MTQNYPLAPIFNVAIKKLEAQGFKAYDAKKDICLYRYENGACLFGHMIKREHYKARFDKNGVTAGNHEIQRAISASTGVSITEHLSSKDLCILQNIHDDDWTPGKPFRRLIPAKIQMKIWGEVQDA